MSQQVFGQIFEKDKPTPVFTGISDINIEKGEAHVRSALKKAYPNIRKASLALLRPDKFSRIEVPQWLSRVHGTLTFSAEQIVARVNRSVKRRVHKKVVKSRR